MRVHEAARVLTPRTLIGWGSIFAFKMAWGDPSSPKPGLAPHRKRSSWRHINCNIHTVSFRYHCEMGSWYSLLLESSGQKAACYYFFIYFGTIHTCPSPGGLLPVGTLQACSCLSTCASAFPSPAGVLVLQTARWLLVDGQALCPLTVLLSGSHTVCLFTLSITRTLSTRQALGGQWIVSLLSVTSPVPDTQRLNKHLLYRAMSG